jgi:hypothetical protein
MAIEPFFNCCVAPAAESVRVSIFRMASPWTTETDRWPG